jgi:bifunctional ADP-heptose synthase (sugar kinase/adenylyltransferase)
LHTAKCRFLLVTRGNLGMALFGAVCGAGDTVAAVFAAGLAAGYTALDGMGLANAASGVVVLEHGTAVCRIDALEAALVAPSGSRDATGAAGR